MAKRGCIEIIGFWHICMINHYMDIISEQMDIMQKSGLYGRLDRIYVGCVGDMDEYIRLRSFFKKYRKVEIYAMSKDLNEYEFLTLDVLNKKSIYSDRFYGFYIHTKGCSYPGNEGGRYWLCYMNHYNITKWKDAVKSLDIGHETYGVKLIPSSNPPAYKMHYSGNFFWFDSYYAADLKNIYDLDIKNRGNAEMWICSENPIAATGCQIFVDYNTVGRFEPFKIKSNI